MVFPKNGPGTTVYSHAKKKNDLDMDLTHFTKRTQMDHRPKCKKQNSKTTGIGNKDIVFLVKPS